MNNIHDYIYRAVIFEFKEIALLIIFLNSFLLILIGGGYLKDDNQVVLDININAQNKMTGELSIPLNFLHKNITYHIFLPFIINQESVQSNEENFDVASEIVDKEYTHFAITQLSPLYNANTPLKISFDIFYYTIDTSAFPPGFYNKSDAFQLEKRNDSDFVFHLNFDIEASNHPFDDKSFQYKNVIIPSEVILNLEGGISFSHLSCPPIPASSCDVFHFPAPTYDQQMNKWVFSIPIVWFNGRNSSWVYYTLPSSNTANTAQVILITEIATFLINSGIDICFALIPILLGYLALDLSVLNILPLPRLRTDLVRKIFVWLYVAAEAIPILFFISVIVLLGWSGVMNFLSQNQVILPHLLTSFIILAIGLLALIPTRIIRSARLNQTAGTPPPSPGTV